LIIRPKTISAFFKVAGIRAFLAIVIAMSVSLLPLSLYAQCRLGTSNITWDGAGTGSQTVIPSAALPGVPDPIIDQATGCTNSSSVNNFNVVS
jgi:hypothetical protein